MKHPTWVLAALLMGIPLTSARADSLTDSTQKALPALVSLYRDLHGHPELSFHETRTAAILANEMRRLGFDVTTGVGHTGVVAVKRNGPGPVLLIRADMAGFPIAETTGLPFASKAEAVTDDGRRVPLMHAYGHDLHMSVWVGVAGQLMSALKDWSGTLVMVAQPANTERDPSGARAMLDDGLYTRFPKPNDALSFHVAALGRWGTIGYTPGTAIASVDSLDILVKGRAANGAYPQEAKDAIVLASQIVVGLQTLITRDKAPLDPAVITVGNLVAGTDRNLIASEARLGLTVRAFSPAVRTNLLEAIPRLARGLAIADGFPDDLMPVVTRTPVATPPIINSDELLNRILAGWKARFGADVVQAGGVMRGDDFGVYHEADNSVQSVTFWLSGAHDAAATGGASNRPPLGTPDYAPDAGPTIQKGVEIMTVSALKVLSK